MSEEVKELQDEEREALVSIYDGDKAFKEVNPTTYQYKVCLNRMQRSVRHSTAYINLCN